MKPDAAPAAEPKAVNPKAVFDLLGPFAESNDARLRGNAAHAYAALVEAAEPEVRDRARDHLVALVGADTNLVAGLGPEWERRFAGRALEAFQHLPPQEFSRCCDRLLQLAAEGDTREQRRAYARFFLTLNDDATRRRPAGWLQTLRLMWHAGRPGVGWSLWAATWRCLSVWLAFDLVIESFAISTIGKDEYFWAMLFFSLCGSALLTLCSLGGQFQHDRRIRWRDIALSSGVFAILGVFGVSTEGSPPPESMALGVALGLFVGTPLRYRRWRMRPTRSEPLAGWEPLVAFGAVTLICMAAALASGQARALGGIWGVLAPTAAVVSWLDEWLVRKGAQPLRVHVGKTAAPWAVTAPAAAIVVAAIALGWMNWSRATGYGKALNLVTLPDDLRGGAEYKTALAFGAHMRWELSEPGNYQVRAGPASGKAVTLHIEAPKDVMDPKPATSTALAPAIVDQAFPAGRYDVCVSAAGMTTCKGLKTLTEFGTVVMSGAALNADIAALRPSLVIAVGKAASAAEAASAPAR